jgi:crossover junction endodeoxyribonuclease RusA
MITDLAFQVYGSPAPQGSKRGFKHPHTDRVIIVEQQNRRVRSWRDDVKAAALQQMQAVSQGVWDPFPGPVHVLVVFQLTRPKNHYGSGRNATVLKPSAPRYPARMPDLDKLERSTYDALTAAGVWADDGQIVMAEITKIWAPTGTAGAFIRVTDLDRLNAAVADATPIEDVPVSEALL